MPEVAPLTNKYSFNLKICRRVHSGIIDSIVFQSLLSPPPSDFIARIRWYIKVRWFVLCAIAVPGVLSLYVGEGWSDVVRRDIVLGIIAIASNGIFYFLGRLNRGIVYYQRLAIVLVSVDALLVTSLIFLKGGIESRSLILYVIPIMISAAMFGRRGVYIMSAATVLMYDALITADFMNVIHSIGAFNPHLRSQFAYYLNSIVFISSVLLIIGVIVDFITSLLINKERQACESIIALREAQAIAKIGSWEWDVESDKVMWSDELYKMFNLKPRSNVLIGYESYLSVLHPDDMKMVNTEITRAAKKSKRFGVTHRIIWPNGVVRYIQSDGRPILNESGVMTKMIGTARDITDERLLDEAKSEFVSLASHQLRTPATGVKQYIGMLLEGFAGELSETQIKFLKTAYESNERQLSIVNDLLNVARVDSGKVKLTLARVNLVKLMQEIIDEQESNFRSKNQTIVFNSESKRVFCQVDKHRLRMALENIIDNAHKYTLQDKTITVTVVERPRSVSIVIADQGVGIAKKDVAKIFDKFSRVEHIDTGHESGTGLGLYWAHRIVCLHGGKIDVESKLDKGTKFKISLPHFPASKNLGP